MLIANSHRRLTKQNKQKNLAIVALCLSLDSSVFSNNQETETVKETPEELRCSAMVTVPFFKTVAVMLTHIDRLFVVFYYW